MENRWPFDPCPPISSLQLRQGHSCFKHTFCQATPSIGTSNQCQGSIARSHPIDVSPGRIASWSSRRRRWPRPTVRSVMWQQVGTLRMLCLRFSNGRRHSYARITQTSWSSWNCNSSSVNPIILAWGWPRKKINGAIKCCEQDKKLVRPVKSKQSVTSNQ